MDNYKTLEEYLSVLFMTDKTRLKILLYNAKEIRKVKGDYYRYGFLSGIFVCIAIYLILIH
jgi:hypothetical protein